MWLAAFFLNTQLCTLVYTVAIVTYNEGGLAAIPGVKNIIGAIGLTCYCWGTTIIFGNALQNLDARNAPVLTRNRSWQGAAWNEGYCGHYDGLHFLDNCGYFAFLHYMY